jgi:RarD protein
MTPTAAAPGGQHRQALAAALACYFIWGAVPGVFILMDRLGASPWEILGQRALWSPLWAAGLVVAAGQTREALGVFVRPRTLGLLLVSATLIGTNWAVFIWAVNNGHNIDSSLGYFINPLLNMAAGAVLFRERIDAVAWTAIALAAIGVVLQTLALGHLPLISLFLATSFCAYGVIRKRVAASAQTGLLIECLLIAGPGIAYLIWLYGRPARPLRLVGQAAAVLDAGVPAIYRPDPGLPHRPCHRRDADAAPRRLLRLHLVGRAGVRLRRLPRRQGATPANFTVIPRWSCVSSGMRGIHEHQIQAGDHGSPEQVGR